jgi:hypothetical protein
MSEDPRSVNAPPIDNTSENAADGKASNGKASNGKAKKRPRERTSKPQKARSSRKVKKAPTEAKNGHTNAQTADSNGNGSANSGAGPNLPGRLLSTYKPKKLRWFDEPYVLHNRLNLVAGTSDAGKSSFLAYLMAKARRVVLFPGFEEDIEQDVLPRLLKHGVDPGKVRVMPQTDWRLPHCEGEVISTVKGDNADLLLFDPGSSYLPDNAHQNDPHAVRVSLEAMCRIAAKAPVTVAAVKHSGKDESNVMSGCAAWRDVPRSVVHLRSEPSSVGRRIIELFKKSRVKGKESRWYDLVGERGEPPLFVLGERLTDIEQVMVADADDSAVERSLHALAMDMIPLLLQDTPKLGKWMYEQAEAQRIGRTTFFKAAKAHGVIMERKGVGQHHQVVWRMPGVEYPA